MQGLEILVGIGAASAAAIGAIRRARPRMAQRDPQRAFTEAQRQAIFARAQNRCEHVSALGLRCRRAAESGDDYRIGRGSRRLQAAEESAGST